MKKDKASVTARKVALNIVTLGAKPGMDKILPPGIVDSTTELLVASGAVGATGVRWLRASAQYGFMLTHEVGCVVVVAF